MERHITQQSSLAGIIVPCRIINLWVPTNVAAQELIILSRSITCLWQESYLLFFAFAFLINGAE
jgi:hypothetical protein